MSPFGKATDDRERQYRVANGMRASGHSTERSRHSFTKLSTEERNPKPMVVPDRCTT